MKCYVDARGGTHKDAIAVCNMCGVGLCEEHLLEEGMERHGPGLTGYRDRGRLILCEQCAEARGLQRVQDQEM